jgi:hypothetical protein
MALRLPEHDRQPLLPGGQRGRYFDVPQQIVEDGVQQGGLVRQVAIEGVRRHAQLFGHPPHRQRLYTLPVGPCRTRRSRAWGTGSSSTLPNG